MRQVDAHEVIFDVWDAIYPHDEFSAALGNLRATVQDAFGAETEVRVLDLCCAQARTLTALNSITNVRLFGLDRDERMLAVARRKVPSGIFTCADVLSLPGVFRDQTFHCITMTGGTIQLFTPSERERIFAAIRRMLVPDGGMCVVDVFRSHSGPQEDRAWVRKWIRNEHGANVVIFCREVNGASSVQRVYVIDDRRNQGIAVKTGSTQFFDITQAQLLDELRRYFATANALETAYQGTEFAVARMTMDA